MKGKKDGDRYSPIIREQKKLIQLPKEIRGKLHTESNDKRPFWRRDREK